MAAWRKEWEYTMRSRRGEFVVLVLLALAQAGTPAAAQPAAQGRAGKPSMTRGPFGTMPDGQAVEVFTLTNANGVEARFINYGATLISLRTPDRSGQLGDIVMGHDDLESYRTRSRFFGCVVGRYGNRIAKGTFTLGGKAYTLATNNGPNHLHGGVTGFDKKVWTGEPRPGKDGGSGVTFTYLSKDGEEGYPGNLQARVTYTLNDKNELLMEYHATTDKPTHVNLTNHSYFNLTAHGEPDILGHLLELYADRYLPVDSTLIPTGELAPVEGTPFDFRKPTAIGARIDDAHPQLKNGNGYDHTVVVNRKGPGLVKLARVVEPTSGRVLEVETSEPGAQLYTGNFLDGKTTGKQGRVYRRRYGFCLETQHFPDSPNQPSFPSTVLRPGQEYWSQTLLRFSTAR
jgi:aldose 1-epimerase